MFVVLFRFLCLFLSYSAYPTSAFARDGCPAGKRPEVLIACYEDADGRKHCHQGCVEDKEIIPTTKKCDEKEILANLLWFHRDAPKNAHTAEVRGILMRIANEDETNAIAAMRAAFKEGQHHRADIEDIEDGCDNETVRRLTHFFAESGRLKNCGEAQPAKSANCADLKRNLYWALFSSGPCTKYAAYFIRFGYENVGDFLWRRAAQIRQGFKMAQGHNQEVFDSVDYIGDVLLINLVANFDEDYVLKSIPQRYYERDNSAETWCPGIPKYYRHWEYGGAP